MLPGGYKQSVGKENVKTGVNGSEIGRRNADIIEKKMTPGQIAVAVGLTRMWLEKL